MIKDEVEPIGGFIGDAFILPAFLGSQALTALIFIMVPFVGELRSQLFGTLSVWHLRQGASSTPAIRKG